MKTKTKTSTPNKKTVDIGGYVPESFFKQLKDNYQEAFPDNPDSVTFTKHLLLKVLKLSDQVVGIRFMYGLDDLLNPNSVKVLLVPCTSQSEYSVNTQALVSEFGYYDHNGHHYSLSESIGLLANHVQYTKEQCPQMVYKEITRGGFFGLNSLLALVDDERCKQVLFHFGLEENVIKPIMEPLDEDLQIFSKLYMDLTLPCPDVCDDPIAPIPCVATIAAERFSNESELDVYRMFRDKNLLNQANGGWYYEMYYFISPLIAAVIRDDENEDEILHHLYFDRMLPFKKMVLDHKYEAATLLLKETFAELITRYQVEFVEAEQY